MRGVSSMLALSAMVIRTGYGKLSLQVAVQPVHRIGERGLLVVDRDHDVEHGYPERAGGERGVGPRPEAIALATARPREVAS